MAVPDKCQIQTWTRHSTITRYLSPNYLMASAPLVRPLDQNEPTEASTETPSLEESGAGRDEIKRSIQPSMTLPICIWDHTGRGRATSSSLRKPA